MLVEITCYVIQCDAPNCRVRTTETAGEALRIDGSMAPNITNSQAANAQHEWLEHHWSDGEKHLCHDHAPRCPDCGKVEWPRWGCSKPLGLHGSSGGRDGESSDWTSTPSRWINHGRTDGGD